MFHGALAGIRRPLRRWRGLPLLVILATAMFAPSAHASIYWGGTISGEVYGETGSAPDNATAWSHFERDAGKHNTLVGMAQGWATFDAARLEAVRDRGAIPVVTMGLAEGVTLEGIAAGAQDAQIRAWARKAKAYGSPFLFAPWREMNGAWYAWGRDPHFVAAWRHFHDLVVQEGATNVTWTWVVNQLWYDPQSDPEPYYPGDQYVDWVGLDGYNWGENPLQSYMWLSPEQEISPTLARLKQIAPGKPVCICENASTEYGGDKADWIRTLLTTYLPQHSAIKAYMWFNWNVFQNGGRFDWPIESSAPAQQSFRDGIQSSYYLDSLPSLTALAKVPLPPPTRPAAPAAASDLSARGGSAQSPALAANASGTSTVVWTRSDGSANVVQARQVALDGTASSTTADVSEPGQNSYVPRVAVGRDGRATVVWLRFSGSNFVAQERQLDADGAPLGPVHDLSEAGQNAGEPQVAVGPDGTATVVWQRSDGSESRVQACRVDPEGQVSPVQTLSAEGGDAVEPQVAVGPNGAATVVWSRFDGESDVIQEQRIDAGGNVAGEVVDLSEQGGNAVEPQVAADPEDGATVVWSRFDGSNYRIQASRVPPDGSPAPTPTDISAAGGDAVTPEVGIASDGAATLAWSRFDGSHWVVESGRIEAEGSLSTPAPLSGAAVDAAQPRLAVSPGGFGTVVWDSASGSGFVVERRRLEPDGARLGTEDLTAAGVRSTEPAVTAGRDDADMVVWRAFEAGGDVVQGAARYEPPPEEAIPAPGSTSTGSSGQSTPTKVSGRSPQAAARRFEVGKPKLDRRHGTALVPVFLPRPGVLSLSGHGLVALRSMRGSGSSTIVLRARGRALKRLRRRGAARVRARIALLASGESASRALPVTLRLARGGSNRVRSGRGSNAR